MTKTAPDLRRVALDRIIKQLDALGCQYKIITAEGKEHGALVLAAQQPSKKKSQWRMTHADHGISRGVLSAYVASFMEDMKPASETKVPAHLYPIELVMKACVSYAQKKWGPGSLVAQTNRETGEILLLRLL